MADFNEVPKTGTVKPYNPTSLTPRGPYWDKVSKHLQQGGRIRFAGMKPRGPNPYVDPDLIPYRTTKDVLWAEGRKGLLHPDSITAQHPKGQSYNDVLAERNLAQYPGAIKIGEFGDIQYAEGSMYDQIKGEQDAWWKYGAEELELPDVDPRGKSLPQLMYQQIDLLKGQAEKAAKERQEKGDFQNFREASAMDKFRYLKDNYLGRVPIKLSPTSESVDMTQILNAGRRFRDTVIGAFYYSVPENDRKLLSGQQLSPEQLAYQRQLAKEAQARAEKSNDLLGTYIPMLADDDEYRNFLMMSGSAMLGWSAKNTYASLKNWAYPNWEERLIDPVSVLNRGILYHAQHPEATQAELMMNIREPIWADLIDPFLSPTDMMMDGVLNVAGGALFGAIGRQTKQLRPLLGGKHMLRYGDEIVEEVAGVLSKTDSKFLVGGLSERQTMEFVTTELGQAVVDGANGVMKRIDDTAKSKSLFGWTASAKAHVYAENMAQANTWIRSALGANASLEEYELIVMNIAKLSSGRVDEVNDALRFLSKYPNSRQLLSDAGLTASHAFKQMRDTDPKWISKVLKDLEASATPAERILKAVKYNEEWIESWAGKNLFPEILNVKDARWQHRYVAKTVKQLDKIRAVNNKIFSTVYLRLSPGYAVRNGVNNTFQIGFDLGAVPYMKSADELMDWLGVLDEAELATVYGKDAFKHYFTGMKRGITAGSEGALTGVKGAEKVSKIKDASDLSDKLERAGGEAIFKKMFPQEMEKLLKGNVAEGLVQEFGLEMDEAKHLENLLLQYHSNVDKTFARMAEDATKGYYKTLSVQNMPDELRVFLKEYNLDGTLTEIIATSEDAAEASARYTEHVTNWIDTAKKNLQKTPPQPMAVLDDTVDVLSTASMEGIVDPIVKDGWITFQGANIRANEAVNSTLGSWYSQTHLSLSKQVGDEKATKIIGDILDSIVLETDGELAILGDMTGRDFMGRQLSGHINPRVQKTLENASITLDRRMKELADLSTESELRDFMARELPKALDDLGQGQLTKSWVQARVVQELTDKRRLWHQSWRDNNYRFAKRVMGDVTEALSQGGLQGLPKIDGTFYSRMDNAVHSARRFDGHLPDNFIEFDLRQTRKSKDVATRNSRFVQLYAKKYGIDKMFLPDGRINQQYLTNIVNKQLSTKFDNLYNITGVDEKMIQEAFRSHSLGELRNVFQTPDDMLRTVDRIITQPANVLIADQRRMEDFVRILDDIDEGLADRFASVVDARKALQNGDPKDIAEADKAIVKLGEEINERFKKVEDPEAMFKRIIKKEEDGVIDYVPEWNGIDTPTPAQMIWDTKDQLLKNAEDVDAYLRLHFDDVVQMDIAKAKDWQKKVELMKDWTKGRVSQARTSALASTKEARDFILHNYADRVNLDTIVSFVAPYHFWHTRNAINWGKRISRDPWMVRPYLKYKEAQRKANEGAPEWYKDRMNLQNFPVLGAFLKNPVYMDIESAVFPLGKMLGMKFGNPEGDKETKAGAFLDAVEQSGINTHSLFSVALGLWHYNEGNKSVANRMIGRFAPQSKVIKAITAKLGVNEGIGYETDPYRLFFHWATNGTFKDGSKALDTYEAGRIAVMLSEQISDGKYNIEEIQEALVDNDMSHPALVQARKDAQEQVSFGQVMSFLGSPAFRPYSNVELQDYKMRQEFSNLFEYKDLMGATAYANEMRRLREKYPSYYGVSHLTRQMPDQRDVGYTYSVIGRIPPSQSTDIYEIVGLDKEFIDKFYETRGDNLLEMEDTDRWEVMSKIRHMGAVLAEPDNATRAEWNTAIERNKQLETELVEHYGSDIKLAEDVYWTLDSEQRRGFLEANPTLGQYMNDKTMAKLKDPLLAKYYSSYDAVRSLSTAQMYDMLDAIVPGGAEEQQAYFNAKDTGQPVRASNLLKSYWDTKDALEEMFGFNLASMGAHLPDGTEPVVPKRVIDKPEELSETEQALMDFRGESVRPEWYQWSWEQWDEAIGDPVLARLTEDWAFRGAELPWDVEQELQEALRENVSEKIDIYEVLPLMQATAVAEGKAYYSADNLPWWMQPATP